MTLTIQWGKCFDPKNLNMTSDLLKNKRSHLRDFSSIWRFSLVHKYGLIKWCGVYVNGVFSFGPSSTHYEEPRDQKLSTILFVSISKFCRKRGPLKLPGLTYKSFSGVNCHISRWESMIFFRGISSQIWWLKKSYGLKTVIFGHFSSFYPLHHNWRFPREKLWTKPSQSKYLTLCTKSKTSDEWFIRKSWIYE